MLRCYKMETRTTKKIEVVENKERKGALDGLHRKDEGKHPSSSFISTIRRTAAALGMASVICLAQSTLTQTMETELTSLIEANGGSSTTIPSFVNGTRQDGLTVNSTVEQLYTIYDSPPVLVSLLQAQNTPTTDTIQQALIALYNATSGSSTTTVSALSQTMITELTSLIEANGGSSTTISSIVNGPPRSDGITTNSTVEQLYTVYDSPPVLVSLLQKYNTPTTDTVGQALIALYNATSGSSDGTTTAPALSQTVVAELTSLVMANGDPSTTITNINNGTMPGINTNSTVQQLESASNAPAGLVGLLKNSLVPSNFTLYQALTQLYNMSYESTNMTTTRSLANTLEVGASAIVQQIASQYQPNFQFCGGVFTASFTNNGSTAQMSYGINPSNLNSSTVNVNIGPIDISGNLNGTGAATASPQLTSIDNYESSIGPSTVVCTSCTVCPSVSFGPFTSTSITLGISANQQSGTATYHTTNTQPTSPISVPSFLGRLSQDVEGAGGLIDSFETYVRSLKSPSIVLPTGPNACAESAIELLCNLEPSVEPVGAADSIPVGATDPYTTPTSATGSSDDIWSSFWPGFPSITTPITVVEISGPVNIASPISVLSTTSTTGTGTLYNPYTPNANGTLTWQGPGTYDITNFQANGGNPTGLYYISDPAFITIYNQDVLSQIGINYWITQLPGGDGSAEVDPHPDGITHLNLWTDYPMNVGVSYSPPYNTPDVTLTIYASVDNLNWYSIGNIGPFENPNSLTQNETIEAASIISSMGINISQWGTTYGSLSVILVDPVNMVQISAGSIGLINKN
jgi:hypothetical protein